MQTKLVVLKSGRYITVFHFYFLVLQGPTGPIGLMGVPGSRGVKGDRGPRGKRGGRGEKVSSITSVCMETWIPRQQTQTNFSILIQKRRDCCFCVKYLH